MIKSNVIRILIGTLCALGLIAVFLFQGFPLAAILGVDDKLTAFFINRTVRFFVNDILAIGLIYAIFRERKYLIFAIWVQLAGVFLFLIPYFILKYYLPHYNGPMINYLHRLILNPTLMLLLILAFYYQKNFHGSKAPRG